MEESASRQESKVLPVGKPAARRRIRRVAVVASCDFLGEQDPQHLGGIPALGAGGGEHVGCGAPDIGQAHAG